jgi:tRNA pseudouridine55 synthase
MDGLLIVDKPVGPSSHDVVMRARRALRERRIGHTGTLDPAASGVLPLVLGRATRLSRFLSGAEKTYEAEIHLGFATTTFDAEGARVGEASHGPWPDFAAVDAALDMFRGAFVQQPPAYSAKKIAGRRSYELARRAERNAANGTSEPSVAPSPVTVRTSALEVLRAEQHVVVLRVACSAGFYVRSLAHDLGRGLGTGAHLVSLRRTRSGDLTIDRAVRLEAVVEAALVPLARMLTDFDPVVLTGQGVRRAMTGCELGPADTVAGFADCSVLAGQSDERPVRLLTETGELVAIATAGRTPGLLHPLVVLM